MRTPFETIIAGVRYAAVPPDLIYDALEYDFSFDLMEGASFQNHDLLLVYGDDTCVFVILRRWVDGKLMEVATGFPAGSGPDGRWKPELTTIHALTSLLLPGHVDDGELKIALETLVGTLLAEGDTPRHPGDVAAIEKITALAGALCWSEDGDVRVLGNSILDLVESGE